MTQPLPPSLPGFAVDRLCPHCDGILGAGDVGPLHPHCFKQAHQDQLDAAGKKLKSEIVDLVKWADANSSRSLQVEPGPSELGDDCDRRLGYRLAQVPEVNNSFDPWAAIVGTAIHGWLERAVGRWREASGDRDWLTETTLQIDPMLPGHADLYRDRTVIDYKTMSADMMKKVQAGGAASVPGYIIQANLYGYGFEQLGYPVERVALVCLPRAGRLRDAFVIMEPYDRASALAAIERMYLVGQHVLDLDVVANPKNWARVPCAVSDSCGLCPWFAPDQLGAADQFGCPGR